MYIVVEHQISDPTRFWQTASDAMPLLPENVKLHCTFPSADGSRAVCLWEAESVEAVRDFLEPVIGRVSRNEYFEVENKGDVAMPSGVPRGARAGV